MTALNSRYEGSKFIVKKGDFEHSFDSIRKMSDHYPVQRFSLLDFLFIWQDASGNRTVIDDPRVDTRYI